MKTEEQILQLPKRNNYHYNLEHVDDVEYMALYYKLSDNRWNKHVEYCKENGFENKFNQWSRILVDVDYFKLIDGWGIYVIFQHLYKKIIKTPYIQTSIQKTINKKQIRKLIHRHILNPPQDKQVDHINHNTLDNRRCNLRIVSSAENMQNKNGARSDSKTDIRGVTIHNTQGYQYYRAQVKFNNKHVFHKYFPFTPQGLLDAEQAAIEARLKYHTHNEMDKVC